MQADGSVPLIKDNLTMPEFEHERLRAPKKHGQSLQIPMLSEAASLWESNLSLSYHGVEVDGISLEQLQRLGRSEVCKLAIDYSRQYLDIEHPVGSNNNIVMAGHQPELFHPGVWYKNFALSNLASQLGATAINLIVDNDVCGNASIRYPKVEGDKVSVGTLPIDQSGPNVAFELRKIVDQETFGTFPRRVEKAIHPLVSNPLVQRVWQHIESASSQFGELRLGQAIAMGRHRLENEIGLATLEVPVSQVSQTNAFARFTKSILTDAVRFQLAYNESLAQYRRVNKVRNASHPVPALESDGDWTETPFWVWQADQPIRARLFASRVSGVIRLTDRQGWQVDFEPDSFVETFLELAKTGVAIRPKALTTTMFSRLVLSDLFLHGIGGAKYDQLTDVISRQFFGVAPPRFMTLSATMKLPHGFQTAELKDVKQAGQRVRELLFHPEHHVSTGLLDQAQPFVDAKRAWIADASSAENSKERHDELADLNEKLLSFSQPTLAEVTASETELRSRLRASEILNSREYSLVLFEPWLLDKLRKISH